MILLGVQDKSLNITVIHICVPIYNAKEAKAEQFYEDLHGHALEDWVCSSEGQMRR